MKTMRQPGGEMYRVWITRGQGLLPPGENETPLAAIAVEPAEPGTMSRDEATVYVEAFNRAARLRHGRFRAVALPVAVRYDGDPRPGETIRLTNAVS